MKTKHTLIILAIGFVLTFVGALFKITHLNIGFIHGNSLLIIGTFIEIAGVALLLYKLFTSSKFKSFFKFLKQWKT